MSFRKFRGGVLESVRGKMSCDVKPLVKVYGVSSLMWELRVPTGFESEGDMIKMMLQEVLKGCESRLGKRVWGKGEVKCVSKVIIYQHRKVS